MQKNFTSKPRTYPKNKEYFELLEKHGMNEDEIAEAFLFSNAKSFRAASSRQKNQERAVNLIKLTCEKLKAKL